MVYQVVVWILKGVIRLMGWKMVVAGAERIPARGGAILASNHVSYLDPVLLGYAADMRGRQVRFLAKRELFDVPGFGWVLGWAKQVRVDRHGGAAMSVDAAVDALAHGEVIAIFPEATISPALVPDRGKSGAARIAIASGAPLIPMALWGGQRIATKGRPRTFRRDVVLAVRVGDPVRCTSEDDPSDVTQRLMAALRDLVDQAARTYPDQPVGEGDDWWVPHYLGGSAPTLEEATELMREDAEQKHARRAARERGGG